MQTRSKSIKGGNKLQANSNAVNYHHDAEVLTGKTDQLHIPEVNTRSRRLKSGKNLQTTNDNSDSEDTEDNNKAVLNGKPNPLFIPEITSHIFRFLKLPDIKNCRLVCQQWNHQAETFQQRLSMVTIRAKRVARFLETFPNAQECKVFTCFQLGRQLGCEIWPRYKFVNFFEKWRQNMRELVLLENVYGPGNYDLSPLLPSTLSKLTIQIFGQPHQRRIISINKICNIRILCLEGCSIDITPDAILNNQEIHLGKVTFLKHESEIPNVLINPLLNFAVLKKASFNSANITLDVQGSNSMDVLSLDRCITVLNWETSTWEIKKKLIIHGFSGGITELGNVRMKYKVLDMSGKHLNVSLLPEGIENLKLDFHGVSETREAPRIYGQHKFQALTKLHLELPYENNFSPLIQHFQHCSNLTTLSVEGRGCRANFLRTSSIPRSVRILHVNQVRIILDQSLEIQSLILHDYDCTSEQHGSIAEVAEGLNVKNLIWLKDGTYYGHRNIFEGDERGNIVKNLIDLKLNNFLVGYFDQVSDSRFETSYFFPLVDTQGMYYLFQHGEKGKAISESEYLKYLSNYSRK